MVFGNPRALLPRCVHSLRHFRALEPAVDVFVDGFPDHVERRTIVIRSAKVLQPRGQRLSELEFFVGICFRHRKYFIVLLSNWRIESVGPWFVAPCRTLTRPVCPDFECVYSGETRTSVF